MPGPLTIAGKVISKGFDVAEKLGGGRLFRAAERAPLANQLVASEQLLGQSPAGRQLWDWTARRQAEARRYTDFFVKVKNQILDTHQIKTPDDVNKMLEVIEFPWYNKRAMTAEEIATYPKNVVAAAADHLEKIEDPIWRLAKAADPSIGYIPGHFTHFPAQGAKALIQDEIARVKVLIEGTTGKEQARLQSHLVDLIKRADKAEQMDATFASMRYRTLPNGGTYGPLNEARELSDKVGYNVDYKTVMDDYIHGAMRKVFLDKYLPRAQQYMQGIGDPGMRDYAFDYIQAQRGMLGMKGNVTLNSSLAQLFKDPEAGRRHFSNAVDVVTRLNYLGKIGLSWTRFPFVNLTQTLLTTYPMVGGKAYMKGILNLGASEPREEIVKFAKMIGAVSETDIRRAVTEHLGRGKVVGKLAAGERVLTYPAFASELTNRLVTVAAGMEKAKAMGLKPSKMMNFVKDLVVRTQFSYHPEALPLAMSHPLGKLMMQFRSFPAFYMNYISQIVRNRHADPATLARALAAMGALAGTSAIPGWNYARKVLLKTAGADIGEFNPVSWASSALGVSPSLDFGSSLEPWNVPYDVYSLGGPTIGPIAKFAFETGKSPDDLTKNLTSAVTRFAPPITAASRGVAGFVEGDRTVRTPKGTLLGTRSVPEMLYMRPSLEAANYEAIDLIARAIHAKRFDLIQGYVNDAKAAGGHVPYILQQARQRARSWR